MNLSHSQFVGKPIYKRNFGEEVALARKAPNELESKRKSIRFENLEQRALVGRRWSRKPTLNFGTSHFAIVPLATGSHRKSFARLVYVQVCTKQAHSFACAFGLVRICQPLVNALQASSELYAAKEASLCSRFLCLHSLLRYGTCVHLSAVQDSYGMITRSIQRWAPHRANSLYSPQRLSSETIAAISYHKKQSSPGNRLVLRCEDGRTLFFGRRVLSAKFQRFLYFSGSALYYGSQLCDFVGCAPLFKGNPCILSAVRLSNGTCAP